MADQIRGLLPDGRLPSTAVEHVQEITGGAGGGGIQEVEGVVPLPEEGPRIREFYSVGEGVTMSGEFFPPDTAFVVRRRTTGGSDVAVVGEGGTWRPFGLPPEATNDVTPPTAGMLSVTTGPTAATLTVTGAMDDVGLHTEGPYRFTRDEGTTWTPWQLEPVHVFEGLVAEAEYTFWHEVRDQAGNVSSGEPVTAQTTDVPTSSQLALRDTFSRIASGGWGSPDVGPAWVGTRGSVDGGRGLINRDGPITSGPIGSSFDLSFTMTVREPVAEHGGFFIRGAEFVVWNGKQVSIGVTIDRVDIPGQTTGMEPISFRFIVQDNSWELYANDTRLTPVGTPAFTSDTFAFKAWQNTGIYIDNVEVMTP